MPMSHLGDDDGGKRRIQLQNILLQELNNHEDEDRCIDKFHSIAQLSQTNVLQTFSSFVQALSDYRTKKSKHTTGDAASNPPIVVKLPLGSLTDIIKRKKRTRKRSQSQSQLSLLSKRTRRSRKHTASSRPGLGPKVPRSVSVVTPSNLNTPAESSETLQRRMPRTVFTITEPTESPAASEPYSPAPILQSLHIQNGLIASPDLHIDEASNVLRSRVSSATLVDDIEMLPLSESEHHFSTFKLEPIILESGEEVYLLSLTNEVESEHGMEAEAEA